MIREYMMGPNDDGRRADRIVRKALPNLPLSAIHRLFRAGNIRANGLKIRGDSRLRAGDLLRIEQRAAQDRTADEPQASSTAGEKAPAPAALPRINILLRNDDFVVVNKDEGVLVHGPQSLEEAIRTLLSGSETPSVSFRPGPLHRLDQGTSGIIVFSASLEGAQVFSKALHDHKLRKEYLALVTGILERELCLDERLERMEGEKTTRFSPGGKEARTIVSPLAHAAGMSLVQAVIEGGRTHQIRAHLSGAGFPLVNDRKYAGPTRRDINNGRLLLHAYRLEQEDGISLNLPQRIEAPLPPRFLRIIRHIFGPETARLVLY